MTRVLKLDAAPYYDVAASSPELVQSMAALARERSGGLQTHAAEPRRAHAVLIGTRWDGSLPRSAPFSRTQSRSPSAG